MKILICGTRDWDDAHPIYVALAGCLSLLEEGEPFVVIQGGARGADSIAKEMGELLGADVKEEPADWSTHGKAAGPTRNQKMLDNHQPDVVYAFRLPGRSPGTDDMVSRAKNAGIPTYIIKQA